MLNRFRGWLQQQTPIDQPALAEVKIEGGVAEFGTTGETIPLNFPLLSNPEVSSDFSLSTDISENYYYSIDLPIVEEKAFPRIEKFPEIVDILEVLAPPGYSGKAYGVKEEKEKYKQQKLPFDPSSVDKSICKHGIPKYACGICFEEEEKKITRKSSYAKKIKTINVFDILLPYLQPPFEYMLDQPILFPPGRRPFDYQVEGIRFLAERTTALLGDDMGLGKTIQAIIAIRILVRRRKIIKGLIVCPLSLIGNWEKEIKKWAPELIVMKVRGPKELREHLWKSPSIIYLTTYETLRDDTNRHLISGAAFNLVVLDEIQRIKNVNSGLSKAVRRFGPEYRWGLSGTPLENKLDDVTAIFRFLEPRVFNPGKKYSSAHVRRSIKPYFLRRRILDVIEQFPNKLVSEVWLDLNGTQRLAYDDLLNQGKSEISRPGTTRIHIFALINKLKQICNIEPTSGESCKADYLLDQLGEVVEGGYKALVFSQFPKKTLVTIKSKLEKYDPVIFHGGLTSRQRNKILDDFQEQETPKILLASIKAAGIGLNLQRANHVFHFDHWWNPAIAKQAEARAWRIGQELPVFVHDIYTNNTIEERIHEILLSKTALFNEVINDLSSDYTKAAFSDDDLYKIFDLDPPEKTKKSDPEHSRSVKNLVDQLRSFNPKQFEQIVASYYEKLGFRVEVSGGAYDEGVDIVARLASELGLEHYIIQCKHYPDAPIGPSIIREMIGTRVIHKEATSSVVVTSGTFSAEATRLAVKSQVKIIDGKYLVTLLNKHKISLL